MTTEPKSAKGTRARSPQRGGQNGPRSELMEARIIEVASRLFSERGFDTTSLHDVADAMGVSRPTIYYYMRSKEDILARLVEEFPVRDADRMREIRNRADLSPTRKLHQIVRAHVAHVATTPGQLRMLDHNENHLTGAVARAHEKAKRAVLVSIKGVIQDGIDAGEFQAVDPRTAALGVLGMCNWVSWWFQPDDQRGEDVAARLADLAERSLALPSEPSGSSPRKVIDELREHVDRLAAMLPAEE